MRARRHGADQPGSQDGRRSDGRESRRTLDSKTILTIGAFIAALGVLYYSSGGVGGKKRGTTTSTATTGNGLRFEATETPGAGLPPVSRVEDPIGSLPPKHPAPSASFHEPEHVRTKTKTYSLTDGGATATAPEDWAAKTDTSDAACSLPTLDDSRSTDMLPPRPVLASCRYGVEEGATGFARLRDGQVQFDTGRCPYGRSVGRDDFGSVTFSPIADAASASAPFEGDFAYARCRATGSTDVLTRFAPSAEAAARARTAAAARAAGTEAPPSVLLLHVAGLSRRQALRALPRTLGLLRQAEADTAGDWVGFHARRAHAPTEVPRHNLAALLGGRVSFGRFDAERPADWAWEQARAAGYVTAVGNNGCDREAPTFAGAGGKADHDLLSRMACSVLQRHFDVSAMEESPAEQLCVAGRHFHDFFLDQALAALTAPEYAGLPVFAALSLHDAADRMMQRAYSLDGALFSAVRRVMEEAPGTVVVLAGEGGNTESEYYFGTRAGRAEAVLPAAFMLFPGPLLASRAGAAEALRANADTLLSPASLYSTLLDVMGAPGADSAAAAAAAADDGATAGTDDADDADDAAARRGLLAPLPPSRGCSDAAVQPSACQCAEWTDTDRDSRGLAEFVLSEVNARIWRPNYYKQDSRRACQAMRLAEVEEVSRLSFPAQESSPAATPLLPSPQRFRVRLRTRGGRGFKGQVFEAEVIDFTWRFQRSRDRGIHQHSVFDVESITRVTPTDAYKRCLGAYDGESTPLDFCVCDVTAVRDDDAEFAPDSTSVDDVLDAALKPRRRDTPEVDDAATPQAAVRVPMVQKDEVEMLRWSHNGVETFEVNNMKNADIMFKISMQRGVNGVNNVRSSHSMPVWRYVPAFTTRALTVLEREVKDEPWTWNFDWRWDVVDRSHYEPPRFLSPVRFKSLDVFYKMREGVAIVKLFDMFPKKGKRRSVAYEVVNLRTEPIEYELEVFMSGARRVRAPAGSHKRIRLDPGEQKQLVHIEATTGHPEKAREALHALKHVGSWESLGA